MSKYRAVKTNGYDSKKEARYAEELRLLERSGAISDLREQVVFELIPKQEGERAVKYIADFTYVENGQLVVCDVKSPMTRKLPVWAIKRKLMLYVHHLRVREV